MAIIQASRFAQFYRRLCSLKESFVVDLQETLQPVFEVNRIEAADLYRNRGEELWYRGQVVPAGAAGTTAFSIIRPSTALIPGGQRMSSICVVEEIHIRSTLAAFMQLAIFTDGTEPGVGPGIGKVLAKDGRHASSSGTSAPGQSEVLVGSTGAFPVASQVFDFEDVPAATTVIIKDLKLVLFPPLHLTISTNLLAAGFIYTAWGYERAIETQEAV